MLMLKYVQSIGYPSFGMEQMDRGLQLISMSDGTVYYRSYLFTEPVEEGQLVDIDDTYEYVGFNVGQLPI